MSTWTAILISIFILTSFAMSFSSFTKEDKPLIAEYSLMNLKVTNYGLQGELILSLPSDNRFGVDIQLLNLEILFESNYYVRIRITDPADNRWEVPQQLVPRPSNVLATDAAEQKYKVKYTMSPFTIEVVRNSDGKSIFKSSPSLVYKDQYINVSTYTEPGSNTYGLGESTRLNHALKNGQTYTLWASDDYSASVADGDSHGNLYSAYPHYMQVDQDDGSAHGVMLMNSNGMDVILSPDGGSISFNTIGGIIDLYVMVGPTPIDVVTELTSIIGRPAMMPYWSLGFHNCKWGYTDLNEVRAVVANYSKAGIPLDTQWLDIDYMNEYMDFTVDPIDFPLDEMKEFVDSLHDDNKHFGMIIDPCIKTLQGYSAYDEGMSLDIFVKGLDGKPYMAQVWPAACHFPDFLNPSSEGWWANQFSNFYNGALPFDGVWIDMNEVSNFCNLNGTSQVCQDSAVGGCPAEGQDVFDCCLVCQEIDSQNNLDFPPYAISNNMGSLSSGTLPMSATHYGNVSEYNAHNLYGLSEQITTASVVGKLRGKRPFVLTRSSFLGTGHVGAKWTGDNGATWDDLKSSIISIMDFNMVGIPMIGAEICGFNYNTTEELCARWIEVGAFYPFSRDHNRIDMIPQELYRWESVATAGRNALNMRYRLLPYLYTLFYLAHKEGRPVIRPLWMNFPTDKEAHHIQTQFMWGDAIVISPVLEPNSTQVHAYFPKGIWYDFSSYSFAFDTETQGGMYKDLYTPLMQANVHFHGGHIIPLQSAALNTAESRLTPYTLLVAMDASGYSEGTLYLDDGEQLELNNFIQIGFTSTLKSPNSGYFLSSVISQKGKINSSSFSTYVSTIIILGANNTLSKPSKAYLNDAEFDNFIFDEAKSTLTFYGEPGANLLYSFVLKWA